MAALPDDPRSPRSHKQLTAICNSNYRGFKAHFCSPWGHAQTHSGKTHKHIIKIKSKNVGNDLNTSPFSND